MFHDCPTEDKLQGHLGATNPSQKTLKLDLGLLEGEMLSLLQLPQGSKCSLPVVQGSPSTANAHPLTGPRSIPYVRVKLLVLGAAVGVWGEGSRRRNGSQVCIWASRLASEKTEGTKQSCF